MASSPQISMVLFVDKTSSCEVFSSEKNDGKKAARNLQKV